MKPDSPPLIAALSAMALAGAAAAVPVAGPDPRVVATIQAVIEAGQKGDIASLGRLYAPDCTFVDEFAPFLWTGPGSVSAYFTSGARMYQQTQHKDDRITAGPPAFIYVSDDRAFVVEPLGGTANVGGKPYASRGAYAFSLSRIDGRWMITSQTWTKASESRNPY